MHSCCPKGSWPQLQVNYQPKGEDLLWQGVPIYHVGNGQRTIVMISDIFGATSSRHRNTADIFASMGYKVFLPQILMEPYKGELNSPDIMKNIKGQSQQKMEHKFQKILEFLHSKGIKHFFSVGFCWGVWEAFKLSAKYEGFIAIMGLHPSLGLQQFFGGNQLELTNRIKCPSYFCPAQNDPANIKEGGQLVEALKARFGADKVGVTQFPDMIHGWTVRGDLADQKVARDVHKAIHLTHDYFSKF